MTLPTEQAETEAFLRTLSGGGVIETPISAIFLGTDCVWKLRKAVKLTFLDFTPLAERERTSRRELALNAAAAKGMYRDVVPITRGPAGLAIDGPGAVVDWVVRMARVPAPDFLDQVAARGGLTPSLLDQTADAVAELHQAAAPSDRDALAGLRATIEGNHASCLAAGLPAEPVAAWQAAILAAVEHRAAWFAGRTAGGFVRRVHGDLHLGNLCLWHGAPVPFDALEFSEAMATIDLGYDIAFLLMDLEIRAGRAAANRVLNRYVARTGDVAMLMGLPVFLSLRAMVRAHVRRNGGQDWQPYFAYAQQALQPVPPVVVGIGGLPGSGKSTLARALAPRLGPPPGALVLRSDECRKRRFGVKPEQRLPREAYAPAVSHAVMTEIFDGIATAARAGHAVIGDLTFMALADRDAARAAAGDVPFHGVWLQAPLAILETRVAARTGDASDADLTVLHRAAAADPGPGDWLALDATDPALVDTLTTLVTKTASPC